MICFQTAEETTARGFAPVPTWRICCGVIDTIHPGLRQVEIRLPQERKMGGDIKGRDGEAFPADLIFCLFPSPHHCWLAQDWQQGHGAGLCHRELCFTRAIANTAVPRNSPYTSIRWKTALKRESPFPATACRCQCEGRPTGSGWLVAVRPFASEFVEKRKNSPQGPLMQQPSPL